MLTAQQIAEHTSLGLHVVRYRLSELVRTGKVEAIKIGQTNTFPASAVKKVANFNKKI